jgi:hypothetical protein
MADFVPCGARLRPPRVGTCPNPPVTGKTRCRLHGGAFGSGRPMTRAKTLKAHFGALYTAAREDADLKKLEADLTLCQLRERELLSRLEAGDSPAFRQEAVEYLADLDAAVVAADPQALREALQALRGHLTDGLDHDGTWEALAQTSARKARLAVQIADIETKAGNCLTARAALTFMTTVMELVKAEIGEDGAYRIGQRFRSELAAVFQPDISIPALPESTAARKKLRPVSE